MSSIPQAPVRNRRVFYIPGYDPIPPRRYRELYRKEGAEQARLSGYDLRLAPFKPGAGRFGWSVEAEIGGQRSHSVIEVLVWSDIVRDSMDRGIAATYLQLARTAWVYLRSGILFQLMRLRKGPVIAALYPVGFLLLQLALALALAGLVHLAGARLSVLAGVPPLAGGVLALAGALAAGWALLRAFRAADGRFFAYYLMHDFAYGAQGQGAIPPELEARLASFTARIAAALREDVEEVLVVGHSSGVHLGVSVLADLTRAGQMPRVGPALSFLSLGQVVPMVSFLPCAHRLRADLAWLSACEDLTWVDVTAPGDGCAFALCDPVAVSGVAPPDKRWPLVISAAFSQTLSPARWRRLKWRFFRVHFQYLCAFDRPGDFEYFAITAGPCTLAQRFAGRSPSPSRIERAVAPRRGTGA